MSIDRAFASASGKFSIRQHSHTRLVYWKVRVSSIVYRVSGPLTHVEEDWYEKSKEGANGYVHSIDFSLKRTRIMAV